MVEKVMKLGILKEKGFLYYVDPQGILFKIRIENQGRGAASAAMVKDLKFQRNPGFNYFIDEEGDLARVPAESR